VQIEGKKNVWFEVKVGAHQGSVLGPLLFAIVMHAQTDHLNNDTREFLYADDLAILGTAERTLVKICQMERRFGKQRPES